MEGYYFILLFNCVRSARSLRTGVLQVAIFTILVYMRAFMYRGVNIHCIVYTYINYGSIVYTWEYIILALCLSSVKLFVRVLSSPWVLLVRFIAFFALRRCELGYYFKKSVQYGERFEVSRGRYLLLRHQYNFSLLFSFKIKKRWRTAMDGVCFDLI